MVEWYCLRAFLPPSSNHTVSISVDGKQIPVDSVLCLIFPGFVRVLRGSRDPDVG